VTRRFSALLSILLLTVPSFAQSVKLPESVSGLPGEWIVIPYTVDGGKPQFRLSEGLTEVNIAALLGPDATKNLSGRVVKAQVGGRYYVEAWNAKGDVASPITTCVVNVGSPTVAQPTPPQVPPANGVAPKYFFLIIRPDGSAQQEYVAYLNNPGWASLVKAGHQVKDYTLTQALNYGVRFDGPNPDVPPGTPLPAVLTLSVQGNQSHIARGPIPLPAPENIVNLPTIK
jgi:hypothetical protein